MKQHIPNLLTLTNLGSGVIALFFLDMRIAIICMIVSLIADVADGAVARSLGVDGPLGAILDSLADLVTFCVVPAVISYHTIFHGEPNILVLAALVIYVCLGCYRLARFVVNNDEGQNFKGMPTPATALVIIGLWVYAMYHGIDSIPRPLLLMTFVICGILNVSSITMLSLKGISQDRQKLIFFALIILTSIITVLISPALTILITMSVYIMLGIIFGLLMKENH